MAIEAIVGARDAGREAAVEADPRHLRERGKGVLQPLVHARVRHARQRLAEFGTLDPDTPVLCLPEGSGPTPTYAVRGHRIDALADGATIGLAVVHPPADGDSDAVRTIDIDVDAAWQRRGVGTRLLGDSARLARRLGADEVVLTTAHDNRAVLPMVLAAGMRGRIRMAGETLTVRIGVRELKPLAE